MKLRNKQTGEIAYSDMNVGAFSIYTVHNKDKSWCYTRLKQINEEWEEYKPAEPLIKATDVRHILKQWARTNLIPSNSTEIEVCQIDSPKGTITQFYSDGLYIQFWGKVAPNAIHGRCYTIDELCGEGGEWVGQK